MKLLYHYVKELYVVVFEFLTEIFTSWSKSSFKRFLTSFDEKAVTNLFTEKHRRIVAIERRMERESNLEFQKQMLTDQRKWYQAVLHGQDYSKHQANLILSLGAKFQQYLEQQTQPSRMPSVQDSFSEFDTQRLDSSVAALTSSAITVPDLALTSPTLDTHSLPMEESQNRSEVPYEYHRQEILNYLRTFLDRLGHDMNDIIQMTFRASHSGVDSQIRNRLLSWTEDVKSNRLWIQGPSGTPQPSQNRLTAVCLTALSRQNHIPCISYFCSPDHSRPMCAASYNDALKAMLASLITQLTLLLPDNFTTLLDLSSARFDALKSDDNPLWNSGLELLYDLRTLAPKYLHCIVDGIQVLENRSDFQHTQNLSNLILKLCTLDDEKAPVAAERITQPGVLSAIDNSNADKEEGLTAQVTKICFTTDGYSDAMAQIAALNLVEKVEYGSEADEPFAEDSTQFLVL